ncbi:MAG: hypothetical protein ABI700_11090 [Chloroflexota bacterium]
METVIMVQIADRTWTLEALHCAGRMAREQSAKIALVKMIPVQHLGWLGTDFGYLNLSEKDEQEIADYAATLEDYGVEYDLYPFQYATLTDALVQVAEHIHAQIVFATLPDSRIPFWQRFQLHDLHRHFARDGRSLIDRPLYAPALSPAPESVLAQA